MKPHSRTEAEVLETYRLWLNAYLNGDVATYDSYFEEEYHFIGSTDNEEFLDRKATTQFFANTADQLAGKCRLRNETIKVEKLGALIFLSHFFDAWFLNSTDYTYYGKFRFSSAMRKSPEGWRFVYQHFSTPDSKTDVGQTIGFDKVQTENHQLREAIKRRTVELEQKNNELEIEASLEKVRAVAQ